MPANATAFIDKQKYDQAALGAQDYIIITAVPAAGDQSLVGQRLLNQVLTVNGDYDCLIPLYGLSTALEVHCRATLATKTASTDLDTLYMTVNPTDPTTYVEKTAGTGTGALSTTVRQTSTISTLRGEQFALFTLSVAGAAGSVTVTQAEFNGI